MGSGVDLDVTVRPQSLYSTAPLEDSSAEKNESTGRLWDRRPVQKKCGREGWFYTGIFLCVLAGALVIGAATTGHAGFIAPAILTGASGIFILCAVNGTCNGGRPYGWVVHRPAYVII